MEWYNFSITKDWGEIRKIMEYSDAIEKGFELYDEIEREICRFAKSSNAYLDVKYENEILIVDADCRKKDIEAKIEINRKEIIQRVLDGSAPEEAICQLLKEKICSEAHEYKTN